jgi:hypothetical protein
MRQIDDEKVITAREVIAGRRGFSPGDLCQLANDLLERLRLSTCPSGPEHRANSFIQRIRSESGASTRGPPGATHGIACVRSSPPRNTALCGGNTVAVKFQRFPTGACRAGP